MHYYEYMHLYNFGYLQHDNDIDILHGYVYISKQIHLWFSISIQCVTFLVWSDIQNWHKRTLILMTRRSLYRQVKGIISNQLNIDTNIYTSIKTEQTLTELALPMVEWRTPRARDHFWHVLLCIFVSHGQKTWRHRSMRSK